MKKTQFIAMKIAFSITGTLSVLLIVLSAAFALIKSDLALLILLCVGCASFMALCVLGMITRRRDKKFYFPLVLVFILLFLFMLCRILYFVL